MNKPRLVYFSPNEFVRGIQWFDLMDTRLLVLLDTLRHMWGKPIYISGHRDALGREDCESQSWHNIERHGTVYAADIQPTGLDDQHDAYMFYEMALAVGFGGIGAYPGWKGFHVDTRPDKLPGQPATWGRIDEGIRQTYVSLNDALRVW